MATPCIGSTLLVCLLAVIPAAAQAPPRPIPTPHIVEPAWAPPAVDMQSTSTEQVELNGKSVTKQKIDLKNEILVAASDFRAIDIARAARTGENACLLRHLYSYSINQHIFAYQFLCYCVAINRNGRLTRAGCAYRVGFLDRDGDGRFETEHSYDGPQEIPGWTLLEKAKP